MDLFLTNNSGSVLTYMNQTIVNNFSRLQRQSLVLAKTFPEINLCPSSVHIFYHIVHCAFRPKSNRSLKTQALNPYPFLWSFFKKKTKIEISLYFECLLCNTASQHRCWHTVRGALRAQSLTWGSDSLEQLSHTHGHGEGKQPDWNLAQTKQPLLKIA